MSKSPAWDEPMTDEMLDRELMKTAAELCGVHVDALQATRDSGKWTPFWIRDND